VRRATRHPREDVKKRIRPQIADVQRDRHAGIPTEAAGSVRKLDGWQGCQHYIGSLLMRRLSVKFTTKRKMIV
jgi:hypothetical protein